MARKKAPSNQGAVWTTKDFAAIRRLVKTGGTGKTYALSRVAPQRAYGLARVIAV